MRNSDQVGIVDIGIALPLLIRFLVTEEVVVAEPRTSQKVVQEQQTLNILYHRKDFLSMVPGPSRKLQGTI